jgi:uncharacterized protein YbjT (DUF2867 family)
MNVLVVGANGQLGSACCRALVAAGHSVRGSVRHPSRAADLDGVELVTADLGQDPDLDALLSGIEVVVVTANVAAPRAGDDPGGVHRRGAPTRGRRASARCGTSRPALGAGHPRR